jgi:hypothetical protein
MLARLKERLPLPTLRRIAPFWIACLILGSLLPGEAKIAIGSSRLSEQHLPPSAAELGEWKHRTFHIVGFGATAFLFLSIAGTATGELASMIGLLGLGVAIEYAQVFVYANRLETEDVRDDAYGVVAVYAVWLAAGAIESWRVRWRAAKVKPPHSVGGADE